MEQAAVARACAASVQHRLINAEWNFSYIADLRMDPALVRDEVELWLSSDQANVIWDLDFDDAIRRYVRELPNFCIKRRRLRSKTLCIIDCQ